MKNSKISKKAKTFLDGLQKYRDGGMQVPLPEYQMAGLAGPNGQPIDLINYAPPVLGPTMPIGQQPPMQMLQPRTPIAPLQPLASLPLTPVQSSNPFKLPDITVEDKQPKPNFNALPVIGSAITLGMGIKEGVESYQAKKRADRLRGYFDQDLAERKKDISLGEYVNTPYTLYQKGGLKLGERVSNFRATDSSQSGTTAGADKMEKAKLSAAQQKENQRILAERKARMERSKAAKGKPISAQQIADESAAIGDKFRVFPDDPNSVVDALNPLVMIGDMAAGLGQVPLNIQEGNYGQAAMNVGMPLLAGALAGGKNAAQLANNLANPLPISSDNFLKNTKRVLNETDIFLDQISGELFRGKANRKAIKKGNEWLEQWVKDPITQKKIEIDLRKLDDIDPEITNPEVLDFINKTNTAIKSQSLNPILNSKEYSLKKQFTDYIDKIKDPRVRDQIHSGNAGVSYTHGFSPIQRENYYNNPQNAFDRFGSWISRSPSISQKGRTSTTIHEGTHDWVSNAALQKSGLKNKVLDIIDPEIADLTTEWSRLRNMGIKPEDTLGYRDSYLGYLGNPTEIHARIMELRNDLDLKPSNLITEEKAKEIIEKVQKGDTPVDPVFFKEVVKNDPKKVASLFNELWTVSPLLIGVGAAGASQEMKEGGKTPNIQSVGTIQFDSNKARQGDWGELLVNDIATGTEFRVKRNKDGSYDFFEEESNLLEGIDVVAKYNISPTVQEQINKAMADKPKKNFAIVDKTANTMFTLSPEGKIINSEPIITGYSKNDRARGMSMKEYFEANNTNNRDEYFQYMKDNNYKTTPSGHFKIGTLRENVTENPDLFGRLVNKLPWRKDKEKLIESQRIRDYGPKGQLFTLVDDNGVPQQHAIHGTGNPERIAALQDPLAPKSLSSGCINVGGQTICFDTLEKDSDVYVIGNDGSTANKQPKKAPTSYTKLKKKVAQALDKKKVEYNDDMLNFISSVAQKESKGGEGLKYYAENFLNSFPILDDLIKSDGPFQINPSPRAFGSYLPENYSTSFEDQAHAVANFYNKTSGSPADKYAKYNGSKMYEKIFNNIMNRMENSYKEGGIHIDPKNKGKFTAAAKRRGMGVQEFANKVMANKEDYSPLLVKRANFARNAAKWEDGGLYPTVSSDYNTTVELANQRQAQAMDLLQKMQEVEQLHKMMYGGMYQDGGVSPRKFTASDNNTMQNSKPINYAKEKIDSKLENFVELIDPTGIYSIDDVMRSYNKTGLSSDTFLEAIGAVPMLGKLGKVGKSFEVLSKIDNAKDIIKDEEFKSGGEMIKRADGSYSRRGLWDNIRANRGSGKKPTKEMLKQERKIRREEMEYGGYMPFIDSMDENNQYMDLPEFGNGGYKVERSNDRKGKTHKVTGPDGSVKYFGDPNMGERSKSKYGKEAFYARHKSNLEKNPHFRAYARATWQNGGQVGLEGFGQMYDNQQAYNQQTQQQFEDFYNRLNQQNVANWRNMRTSAINNIVSGVGGLASAGIGLPGMQNGGEYDPTLDVNSTQFDADAFMGREKGQPSELDALIEAEQAKQMQRSETEMELMSFINEGADTGQANYSNLGMFANNPSSGSSSSSLAGAGEFANVIDEIRYRESRGNYGRVNDVSKTTGAYQFMPIWWADQIQDFMGIDPSASQEEVMEAFRTNPQAQDEFMVHVVNNIYKPQLPKLRPYAQKYGLNDDQLIKLMHYRGVGDAIKRLKTGDFSVSAEEKAKYNNPDVMEYLKGPLPK